MGVEEPARCEEEPKGMEQNPSWDQATLEVMVNNLKRLTEEWAEMSHNKASQQANLQDKLNDQHLRFVEDQHTLVMRTADNNALQVARMNANAATIDQLGNLDALTPPAETAQAAIGAKVAEEVSSTAKEAIRSAVAATAQTSAPAQGTTGVAQGALQTQTPVELAQVLTNNITVQTAILTQLAKLTEAVDVILVKVVGEAVAQPAA